MHKSWRTCRCRASSICVQPYWFTEGGDMTPADFGRKAAKALEDKILRAGRRQGGGVLRRTNPIQGAGGVIIPPGYLLAGDPAHLPEV